jgi:hypothetical protein
MEEATNRHYRDLIQKELADARVAREQGNEGRARVCVRRAAGFAIAWLGRHRGQSMNDNNSLALLKSAETDQTLPEDVRAASQRLTARVTPDFKYPFQTDPIDDARIIIDHVVGILST